MFYINIDDLKLFLNNEYPDESDYFALGAAEKLVLDEKKYFIDEILNYIEENKELL